jgi:hypothetical protein
VTCWHSGREEPLRSRSTTALTISAPRVTRRLRPCIENKAFRPTCPVIRVVSMDRRTTGPKSNLQVFQRLNSFESADSKKTLPCLGLIEYSPKDQVSLKNTSGSTD